MSDEREPGRELGAAAGGVPPSVPEAPKSSEPSTDSGGVSGGIDDVAAEFFIMVRYALEQGSALPEPAAAVLKKCPEKGERYRSWMQRAEISCGALLAAHVAIAAAVAPVTARSLVATRGKGGKPGLMAVPVLWYLMWAGVVSVLLYMFLPVVIGWVQTTGAGAVDTVVGALQQIRYASAAAVGASFYSLFTANRFVVNRTFDPVYTSHYVVRWLLGVISGVIFAAVWANWPDSTAAVQDAVRAGVEGALQAAGQAGGQGAAAAGVGPGAGQAAGQVAGQAAGQVASQSGAQGPSAVAGFGAEIVALLGGYSVEAVNRMLTRMVETMESLVAGRGDSMISSQKAALEAQIENESAKRRLALATDLLKAKEEMGASLDDNARAKLQAIIDDVLSGD